MECINGLDFFFKNGEIMQDISGIRYCKKSLWKNVAYDKNSEQSSILFTSILKYGNEKYIRLINRQSNSILLLNRISTCNII